MDRTNFSERQHDEFYYLFRSIWISPFISFIILIYNIIIQKRGVATHSSESIPYLKWTTISIVIWVLLMYVPQSNLNHQGSYVLPLIGFLIPCVYIYKYSCKFLYLMVIFQSFSIINTWVPSTAFFNAGTNMLSLVLLIGVFAVTSIASIHYFTNNSASHKT